MACTSQTSLPIKFHLFNNNDLSSGFSPSGTMSLYTVEQVELIRRLKATGITVQAIVEAFNEMNTVVTSLDSAPYVSTTQPSTPTAIAESSQASAGPSPVLALVPGPSMLQPLPVTVPSTPVPSIETTLASLMPTPASVSQSMFLALQGQPMPSFPMPSSMLHNNLAAAISAAQAHAAAAAAAVQQQQQAQQQHHQLQLTPPPSAAAAAAAATSASTSGEQQQSNLPPRAPRSISSKCTPMREITTLDDPNELEDFMQQGEEGCIADMKQFITHYSLRQTTVAMMTGVSQPYISKLLNGNHRELSLRCRKNIYCWYLNCRRHPEKLSSFLADPASRLETNCEGELVPQKRERYVFRPVLLRLLDQFFNETPFPDTQRRMEIATACNNALQQDKKGVCLMPKEVVSPQVVSNWFANKRKELRRKSDPRYQDPMGGIHGAIIEALERGANSVPDRSDTGSGSPNDDDTMDGLELLQQQAAAAVAAAPRPVLPPPDYRVFEALGLPSALFQNVQHEVVEIKDEY